MEPEEKRIMKHEISDLKIKVTDLNLVLQERNEEVSALYDQVDACKKGQQVLLRDILKLKFKHNEPLSDDEKSQITKLLDQ